MRWTSQKILSCPFTQDCLWDLHVDSYILDRLLNFLVPDSLLVLLKYTGQATLGMK